MPECYKDKYIYNSEIKDSSSFDESLIENKLLVYEVVRIINNKSFKLEDNYKRLVNSLKIADIDFEIDFSKMFEEINLLAKLNNIEDGNVKFVVFRENDKISSLVYLIQHYYPSDEELERGVKCLSLKAERENPNAKIVNKKLREDANKIIKERVVFEVLLVDHDDFVTEGSRSNLFFIKDNVVYTSEEAYILGGTVRKRAIEICNIRGIKVVEKRVKLKNISEYDAAFLTGTSLGVLPISKIDDYIFNVNNEIMKNIQKEYQALLK